mgnify:CR=1 FL=1
MGVARWLLQPDNPLTARVAVNRFWAQLFGRGLLDTEEDFGTQGNIPDHPELLDWLSVDFVEHGWSLKHLHRRIMTSTTYRQASYRDPTDESEDKWQEFTREAKAAHVAEKDPDPWWKNYVNSPKANSIERTLGID